MDGRTRAADDAGLVLWNGPGDREGPEPAARVASLHPYDIESPADTWKYVRGKVVAVGSSCCTGTGDTRERCRTWSSSSRASSRSAGPGRFSCTTSATFPTRRDHLTVRRTPSILTGPTGSGKTALALELAERLERRDHRRRLHDPVPRHGHRHRQADGGRPGTRAAPPDRRPRPVGIGQRGVVAGPGRRQCVADIEARGKTALFVGGTPFYLKACCAGCSRRRRRTRSCAGGWRPKPNATGRDALHARLAAVDPVTARRLHPNDVRRVVRALEVWHLTGKPISALAAAGSGGRGLRRDSGRGRVWCSMFPGTNFTPGSIAESKRCSRPAGSTRSGGSASCLDR